MQRDNDLLFFLSAALILCGVQLAGCAAPQEPSLGAEAAPPPEQQVAEAQEAQPVEAEPAVAQALESLQQADQAYQDEDYQRARTLYAALAESPEGLSEEQIAEVRARLGRIITVLQERSLEERGKQAREMLHQAATLVDEGKHDEAAQRLAALKESADLLTSQERAEFQRLREAVAAATGIMPGMTDEEAEAVAEGRLEAVLEAYEAKRYGEAQAELERAGLLEQYLGSRDRRRLREVRSTVQDTLARLLADLAGAEERLAAQQYAQAADILRSIQATGVSMGAERDGQVRDLLAQAETGIEELRQRAEQEKKDQAAELLTQAKALNAEGNHQEAAQKLAALRDLEDCLSAEQMAEFQQARETVEEATGILPGMTAQETEQRAEHYFQRGIDAYKDKDYAEAKTCLDRAAMLDVSLGWWDNRKLRKTRAKVTEKLEELLADYERGKQLFSEEQYAEAKGPLEAVQSSGISIGADRDREVADLLAGIDEKIAELQRQQEEQNKQRATELLAEARKLGADGKHEEALTTLDALQELAGYLSPEQEAEVAALCASVESAAEIARIETAQQKAEELAREAAQLVQKRTAVEEKLDAGEAAWRRGNLQEARSALTEAQHILRGMDLAEMPALADVLRQVERRLRDVDTQIKLSQMAGEARELAKTDLLAAETKVLQMQDLATAEGVALPPDAREVCGAVLAAVEAEYGAGRRLRLEEFRGLAELSDSYMAAGEYGKAIELLSLVEGAGQDVVTEDYRNLAAQKLAAAEQGLEQQKDAAERALAQLADARGELERGELEKALDGAAAVVSMTAAENLAGAPLVDVLQKAVSLLGAELEEAMAAARPDLAALADRALAQARAEISYGLSQYYLGAGSPELAEFYLNELAKGAPGAEQYSDWAGRQLAGVDRIKAEAERARLLEVEPQAKMVYDLAAELNRLAREGDLAQVEAASQQLADARLELQVRKVQSALNRGAFSVASALLEAAPTEGASGAIVEQLYQPLVERMETLRTAAANLKRAEEALAAHEFEKAVAHLLEVQQSGVDPIVEARPLVIQKQGLAGVLDAVRSAQDAQTGLRAAQQEELARARASLEEARAREQAWQQHYAGLRAFLLDEDDAAARLTKALGQTAGLRPFEVAQAQRIVDALAEAAGPELLVNDEQAAGAIYAEAVEAYKAGDPARVNEALRELKTRYRHTKVYREHM